jgi:tetratricopeptide (TPR) repeat protein
MIQYHGRYRAGYHLHTRGNRDDRSISLKRVNSYHPALCRPDSFIREKPEYWCMRRVFFIGIVLVLVLIASGCMQVPGDQTLPPPPPQPGTGPETAYSWSGRSIALAVSTDGISTSSPKAREWFIKGLTASTQHARYNESLDYFDQAIRIDPDFTEAWYAKGVALHNMMRYAEAIQCYARALSIDPGNAVVVSLKKAAQVDWDRQNSSARVVLKKQIIVH